MVLEVTLFVHNGLGNYENKIIIIVLLYIEQSQLLIQFLSYQTK